MSLREHVVTILIVTAVTGLIWALAAGETRVPGQQFANVEFSIASDDVWQLAPATRQGITVHLEGSPLAVRNAESVLQQLIQLSLPAEVGTHTVPLATRLRRLEAIEDTGVTIVSVEPPSIEIEVDQMVARNVDIVTALPEGVLIESELVIEPATAQVWMPSKREEPLLGVSAVVEPAVIAGLVPGLKGTIEARLRLEGVLGGPGVRVTPESVNVTLTIKSRTATTTVGSIRVQLAGPPEDFQEFDIQVSPASFRDVTIDADEDIIRRIEDGSVTAIALVHLTSREKEDRITKKPVTCLLLTPSGDVVPPPPDLAEIELTIKRRE